MFAKCSSHFADTVARTATYLTCTLTTMSANAPLLLDEKPTNEVANSISPGAFQPGESKIVQVDGVSVRLDHLGPMVINLDGTVARISNWDAMSEAERLNTLRVLGRRNRGRVEELAKAQGVDSGVTD
ncbi:hypothetical protein FIBSPDRAFT_99110 [Athelia psychrophila]|uniref:Uncharacterized protein n=2 Tax=Athelia psychrophila TaxID=1759441 RepID=A0A167STW7_9AGAM|nr:hypothetical protein FIBSPDRAFT_99110 [Fibularhizoctonia sp. CBS 109695]